MALTAAEQQKLQELQAIPARNAAQERQMTELIFKSREAAPVAAPTSMPAATSGVGQKCYNLAGVRGNCGPGFPYRTKAEADAARGAQQAPVDDTVKVKTAVEKANELSQELGFEDSLFSTERERATRLKTDLERQAEEARQLREITRARNQEQIQAAQSSAAASFLGSREGPQSMAQRSGFEAVGRELTRRQTELSTSLEQQQRRLDEIQKQKRQAFVSGSIERREALAQQEAQTAAQIAETQQQLIEAQERAQGEAMDVAQQAYESVNQFLGSIGPEGLAQLPVDSLVDLVGSQTALFGLSPDQQSTILGSTLAQHSIAQSLANTQPDSPKYQQLVDAFNSVKGLSTGLQRGITPTITQGLVEQGIIDQKTADKIIGSIETDEPAFVQEMRKQIAPFGRVNQINIENIASSEAKPLFTLGDASIVRTDRHNNPTATAYSPTAANALKSAGLVEGKDFTVGEQFPNNPKMATVAFKDTETGVKGAIALLDAYQIGSWYANTDSYSGAPKVISKIAELSGEMVTSGNAQQVFNNLSQTEKEKVLKEIYNFESGGKGSLFTADAQASTLPSPVMDIVDTAKDSNDLKRLLEGSGVNKESQVYGQAFLEFARKQKAKGERSFEDLSFVESALAGIPASLRNAVEERKNFERIIESGMEEGKDFYEVVDALMGIRLQDEDAEKKFRVLREKMLVLEDASEIDYKNVARLINSGDLPTAAVKMENVVLNNMRETGKLTLPEPTVSYLTQQVNRAVEIIDNAQAEGRDLTGLLSGPINKIQAKIAEDPELSELDAILTELFSTERKNIGGTALTDTEAQFLDGMIGTIKDQDTALMKKLDAYKRRTFDKYNIERQDQLLPPLDEEQLFNKRNRYLLYYPEMREGPDSTLTAEDIMQKYSTIKTNLYQEFGINN